MRAMPLVLLSITVTSIGLGLIASPTFGAPGDVQVFVPEIECPHAQFGDPAFQAAYDTLWAAYEKASKETSDSVAENLTRLRNDAQAQGNLDLVVYWDSLVKQFAETRSFKWETTNERKDWKRFGKVEFPVELGASLSKCQDEYEVTRTALIEGYGRLETDLTKKGEVNQAVATRKEMETIQSATKSPFLREAPAIDLPPKQSRDKPVSIIGRWGSSGWYIEFLVGGKAQSFFRGKPESVGQWKAEADGNYSATLGGHWRYEISPQGPNLEVRAFLKGNEQPIKTWGRVR